MSRVGGGGRHQGKGEPATGTGRQGGTGGGKGRLGVRKGRRVRNGGRRRQEVRAIVLGRHRTNQVPDSSKLRVARVEWGRETDRAKSPGIRAPGWTGGGVQERRCGSRTVGNSASSTSKRAPE